MPKLRKRPSLVKQRASFRYPDEDNEVEDVNMDQKVSNEEVTSEGSLGTHGDPQASGNLECPSSEDMTDTKDGQIPVSNEGAVGDNNQTVESQEKDTGRIPPVNPFLKRISFEDLKEEVKLMPTFPPPDFVRTGSDDSGTGCSGTRPGSRAQTRYLSRYLSNFYCLINLFLIEIT